jgi:ABC-2 type transport system permease protein
MSMRLDEATAPPPGPPAMAATRSKTRDVLALLVRRDLAVKYQDSTLGYLWSLLEPLGMALTYWFVFGVIYHSDGKGLPLHVVVGIFAWMWCQAAINESTRALSSQATLITTIKAPRAIFPLGRVVARFAEYLAGIPIIVVFAIIFAQYAHTGWNLLWLPAAICLQFIVLSGFALVLASVNVMYSDVERMMRVVTRIMFYTAPIVYPLTRITGVHGHGGLPAWGVRIYELNPFVGIFQMHHAAWETGEVVPGQLVAKALIGSVLVLGIGWWTFHKLESTVLKEL